MTTDLKAMYKKVHKDAFPETMTILLVTKSLCTTSASGPWTTRKKVCATAKTPTSPLPCMNCVKVASPAAACAGVAPVRASCRP